MSEIKVNKLTPRTNCGTVTLGDSGDTFTIPSGVTISNLGTAAGFGGTGEISWDTTVKTTGTFTATAGVGYFLNTTGGTITVNLPAGAAGSSVALADYAGTWQTSNVTVSPNGTEKIGGTNANVALSTEGQSVTFVYIDGTQGWVNVLDSTSNVRGNPYIIATGGCITTCGNYKMHTFLSPGTFTVSCAGSCAANNLVSYLVLGAGGGGGSGNGNGGGGGGAGGYREVVSPSSPYTGSPLDGYPNAPNRVTVSATPYPIVVGGGGAGLGPVPGFMPYAQGNDGNLSSFGGISSAGGGGGGTGPVSSSAGRSGGSGGGAAGGVQTASGGTGNTPPTTPAQGQNGGSKSPPSSPDISSMGGGGAGGAGQDHPTAPVENGGNGGPGTTTSINGTATGFAGGGGGSADSASRGNDHTWPNGRAATPGVPASNTAGYGGGEGGLYSPKIAGTNGPDNKGGGGGGSGSLSTGTGGSGIVIIRYRYQ